MRINHMAIKSTINRYCRGCGRLQLRDDIYTPCTECAPPGPLSPIKRIDIREVIINESRPQVNQGPLPAMKTAKAITDYLAAAPNQDGYEYDIAAIIRSAMDAATADKERRLILNAHSQFAWNRQQWRKRELWTFVIDLVGTGSTTACEICRKHGWDPHQPASAPLTAQLHPE